MNPEAVTEAVVLLARARRDQQPLAGLPEACRPQTPDDAYEIQEAFVRTWGDDPGGWKVGATHPDARRALGLNEPFYGPVFSPVILRSPAELSASAFNNVVAVECEFAFRFGRDLPRRERPYERAQILDAIQAVIPAFEVITTRYDDLRAYGGLASIADCGSNGALVLGNEVGDWRQFDLATHQVRLEVDGKVVAEGDGSKVLGDPLNSLVWLVERHHRRGSGLRTGEVVTTGSATGGMVIMEPGQTARGDFGALGTVEARLLP